MHDTIVQATSHSSAIVHSRSRPADTGISYSGLRDRTNSQLCAFTQSTPVPMTWMTDTIPVRNLSKAYLRREVGRVNLSLQSVLAMWSQNLPADVEIPPWCNASQGLNELLTSVTVIHQDAVVVAFRLQSLLQGSKNNRWLNNVHSMLCSLTTCLNYLDMHEDSITIQTLIVTIWRRIARWRPSPTSSHHLATSLTDLAIVSTHRGNIREVHSKREEAIEILSSLAVHQSRLYWAIEEARYSTHS